MVTIGRRVLDVLALGIPAAALVLVPTAMSGGLATPDAEIVGAPCTAGIVPGNPYIRNCGLPDPGPRIRGQAPDQSAIIACRGIPGCLSYYVNYPGETIWGPYTD